MINDKKKPTITSFIIIEIIVCCLFHGKYVYSNVQKINRLTCFEDNTNIDDIHLSTKLRPILSPTDRPADVSVRTEIPLTEMVRRHRMQLRRQNLQRRKRRDDRLRRHRCAKQIGQNDAALRDAVLLQHVDRLDDGVAGGHDRIHQQHLTPCNVVRKAGVHDFGDVRVRIRFDQNLADANGATAVAQSLLHCLAGAHNRYAAIAGAVFQPIVCGAGWGDHRAVRIGQLVERLLDDEANQAVGVEFEIAARGVSVFFFFWVGGLSFCLH